MPEAPPQNREQASPQNTGQPAAGTSGRFSRDTNSRTKLDNPFSNSAYGRADNLKYPENLNGPDTEFTHWIAFYPLIRENTSYDRALGNRGVIFDQGGQNRVNADNATAAGGVQGAVLGAQTAGTASLSGLQSAMRSAGGFASWARNPASAARDLAVGGLQTVAGGIIGGVGGAALNGVGARHVKMGAQAIVLGIQDKLSYGYQANYDVADMGALVGSVAAGNMQAGDLMSGVDDVASLAARKVAKLAGAIGGNQVSNLKEATSKMVENPYKEQLFKNMGFRKFGFEYKFSPRSLAEGRTVFGRGNTNGGGGIIGTFLKHMHPEPSASGVFQIYPSEFLIVIYTKGSENTYVRKISNCALTNMTIDYGTEGFTTFQGTTGMPTEATIRLEFTELETLNNNRIQAGY